jgi:pimeloyl-ACP methyl ester carboxylesterase
MFGLENFKSRKIRYKKYSIQTYCYGDSSKKVLALPAFPHSGLVYFNFLKYQPNPDIQIITFDLPGWIGKTDNLFKDSYFSFEECLNICEAVLRAYKVDKFSLLGFSFGTALQTMLAYKLRDRVERLVYVSPMINSMLDRSDNNIRIVERLHRWGLAKPLKSYIKGRFEALYRKALLYQGLPSELVDEYSQLILKSDPTVLLDSVYQLFHLNLTYQYSQLKNKPVLVVNSRAENRIFKRNARLIRSIANHEKNLFLQGRHEDFILKPDIQTCLKVLSFLESGKI